MAAAVQVWAPGRLVWEVEGVAPSTRSRYVRIHLQYLVAWTHSCHCPCHANRHLLALQQVPVPKPTCYAWQSIATCTPSPHGFCWVVLCR
jgi:hypothetical protein